MNFQNLPVNSTYLKPVLWLSGILLVLWIITIQQADSNEAEKPVTAEQQVRLDSLRMMMGTYGTEAQPEKQTSLFQNALPVFVLLLIVLTGLWFWSKKNGVAVSPQGKVLSELSIGPNQWIKAVHFGGEVHVLGLTVHSVTPIKSMSMVDWETQNVLQEHPQSSSVFAKVLKKETEKTQV
jgi:flagellar biogenesis protein FliO